MNRVVDLLRDYRLRPRQIVLEAREATLLGDSADVVRSVRALRRVGVRVALDNFGTGSNALSLLTDVGADVLKLDGGLALPSGSSDADTRVVRALVLSLREQDFVLAARALGATNGRIMRKHLVFHALAPLTVTGTFTVAVALLTEATLSYLGIGVRPPQASWGNMLSDAQQLFILRQHPWY